MSTAGLRERKKLKTKITIQREAMRLFKKQGYGETTIEQIAAAAEISPSTFFNYFPSKEDLVIYDQYDPEVFGALAASPPGESMSRSLQRMLDVFGRTFEADRDVIYERAKLGLEVPELRAHIWGELEKARDIFAAFIAARTGRDAGDFEVRVISMTLVAAAFESAVEWVGGGGKGSMLDLFRKGMEVEGVYLLLDGLEARAVTKG